MASHPLRIAAGIGLCAVCQHRKIITSARGSQFLRCLLAHKDNQFAKYPRLPVRTCVGFEQRDADDVSTPTLIG